MSILIISCDWMIQNVVEQVGITCGYPSLAAESVTEAEAKLTQLGHHRIALIVVDAQMLGEGGADLQIQASCLLQTWSHQYPGVPVMFLGTALQKYAILAARLSLAPFVTVPFGPHDLMRVMQPLLPPNRQSPPISPMTVKNPDREASNQDISHREIDIPQ